PGGAPTDVLNSAISSLQDETSQTEILKALLDGAVRFCGRAALFVVRGSNATGWNGRGFDSNEGIKGVGVDTSTGLASRAVADRMPVAAAAAEFSSSFVEEVGNPVDGNAVVLPLVVKEKVAALLYADAGTASDGTIDTSALHVLARSAGQWLELISLRKSGGAAPAEAAPPAEERVEEAAPPPPPVARPAAKPEAEEAELSPEEQQLHKKARRKAKVLVEEIKLYNQEKVKEGRKAKDLYERLREDIDKSRAEYDKHFGKTSAAGADYFVKELIRILAENDEAALGGNFPR
ncbi:MAG: hypothetical protein ACRD2R_08215, partial [Terriglobales bacterium]